MSISQTKTAISPTRSNDYAQWYQQIIKGADLAEYSSVRGCPVIKPWGCALWGQIQRTLDECIERTGHQNIYCPLLIPLQHLQKEAEHIEGFAKECAVVTHHRLTKDPSTNQLHPDPDARLEQPMIIRPTSETLIGELFSQWIQSHRDLPVLVNQWANVVRWEMRTRPFLRTSEFLWQEGHTAHQHASEAQEEACKMLDVYESFVQDVLAIPVLKGEKSPHERFPGAQSTYCIEAMMQDGKALQMGTSHCLGQNFAKAFNIQFTDQQGQLQHVWTTSWGVSTRLIGGLIMVHGDDNGLQLPPRIAPHHVVILPILKGSAQDQAVIMTYCQQLQHHLQNNQYGGRDLKVHIDQRDHLNGGTKAWEWVKKGVPLRLEVGMREASHQLVTFARRHESYHQRYTVTSNQFLEAVVSELESIQEHLYHSACQRLEDNTQTFERKEDFYHYFSSKKPGFARVGWCGHDVLEHQLQQELGVTLRCILSEQPKDTLPCFLCQKPGAYTAIFAKAY